LRPMGNIWRRAALAAGGVSGGRNLSASCRQHTNIECSRTLITSKRVRDYKTKTRTLLIYSLQIGTGTKADQLWTKTTAKI
jgi:hypothetical protein